MFAAFGCRLTDEEKTGDLLWPPSLTSNGMDQPLFESTPVIYHEPEGNARPEDAGMVRIMHPAATYGLGDDYISPFGYIGTGKNEYIYELDTGFLVSRPDEFHTWRTIIRDRIDWSAFATSGYDESSVSLTSGDKPILTGSFPVDVEIRSRTGKIWSESLFKSERTLPARRKDLVLIRAAKGAFPKTFLLRFNDVGKAEESAARSTAKTDTRLLLRKTNLGTSIAMKRTGIKVGKTNTSRSETVVRARRGE